MGTESTLQQRARALGSPTRHGIFQYLADADHPVDVAELTSHFGLNHNAIRQHLAQLVNAGLVLEDTNPTRTRGRPRLIYRTDPTIDEQWGVAGPYQRLSVLLVDMVASGSSPEETGRRAGRKLDVSREQDPISTMQEAIARGGFEPETREHCDTVEYILSNCPFAEAAAVDPDTVCRLHLGLAQGLADQLESVAVDELIRHDPHRAGCRLSFRLAAPDDENGAA